MQHIFTNKTIKGPSGHILGVPGANRPEEPPSDGLSPGLLSKRPSHPTSLPSGIDCHQGLELKQETHSGLKKKEAGGGFFFFLPFLYNIMTPI